VGQDSSVGIATDYRLEGPGIESSGFGGLAVSMLASGTQDRGFAPDRSRRIFPAVKIHSMPSFGGEVKSSVPGPSLGACKRTQLSSKNCEIADLVAKEGSS
jgi:hypothetical protein